MIQKIEPVFLLIAKANLKRDLVYPYQSESIHFHIEGAVRPESFFAFLTDVKISDKRGPVVYTKKEFLEIGYIQAEIKISNIVEPIQQTLLEMYHSDENLYKMHSNLKATLRAPDGYYPNRHVEGSFYPVSFSQSLLVASMVSDNFKIINRVQTNTVKIPKSVLLVSRDLQKGNEFYSFAETFVGINGYLFETVKFTGMKMLNIKTDIAYRLYKNAMSVPLSPNNNVSPNQTIPIEEVLDTTVSAFTLSMGKLKIDKRVVGVFHHMGTSFFRTEIFPIYAELTRTKIAKSKVEPLYIELATVIREPLDGNYAPAVSSYFGYLFTYSKYAKITTEIHTPVSPTEEILIKGLSQKEIFATYIPISEITLASREFNATVLPSVKENVFEAQLVTEAEVIVEIETYFGHVFTGRVSPDRLVLSKNGLYREMHVNKSILFKTKYSPEMSYSVDSGTLETSYFMNILNFNRTNTISSIIGDTVFSNLISERRSGIGVDMRIENSFSFPEKVRYEYYEYGNNIVIFDFRTFTNPILHLTGGPDLDDVFNTILTIYSFAYQKYAQRLDYIEDGGVYEQWVLDDIAEFSERDSVIQAHNIIKSISFNILSLGRILIFRDRKASVTLFTQTPMNSNSHGEWVSWTAPLLIEHILRRDILTIKKASIPSSYFVGLGTINSGNFKTNLFPANITGKVGTDTVLMESNLFKARINMFGRSKVKTSFKPLVPSWNTATTIEIFGREQRIEGYKVAMQDVSFWKGLQDVFAEIYVGKKADRRVEGKTQKLLKYVLKKEIQPYFIPILRSFSNDYELGVEATGEKLCKAKRVTGVRIHSAIENAFRVDINLANKKLFNQLSSFVQAKLLLAREAMQIDVSALFMRFDTTEREFSQPMLMKYEAMNVLSLNAERESKYENDIVEVKIKDFDDQSEENPVTPSSLKTCGLDGIPYLEEISYDHIVRKDSNTHLGNFSYQIRELLNSAMITRGRFESISPERKISDADMFRRGMRKIALADVSVDLEWDVEAFALTESDFAGTTLTKEEGIALIESFDRLQADMMDSISQEIETNLETSNFHESNAFPNSPDRIIDDGFLMEHKVQQFFTVKEEE